MYRLLPDDYLFNKSSAKKVTQKFGYRVIPSKLVGKYIREVPLECKSPPKDLTSDSISSTTPPHKAHLRVPKGKRESYSPFLSFWWCQDWDWDDLLGHMCIYKEDMVSRVYHGVTISVTYYIFLGRMCHKYCRCVFSLYNLNALSFILFAAVLHILKGEESYFAIDRGEYDYCNIANITIIITGALFLDYET